jgi:exopolysaccharide production protein ExoQ
LTSIAVFFTGIEDRKLSRCLLAIAAGAAEIYALVEARSAGAMLGLGLGVCAFLFLLALRHSALVIRATVTCLLGLVVTAAALFYRTLSDGLIDAGARFFDKDPTLTGRTYLWQRAGDFIAEKPVFGKGFSAFWIQGNTDAEGLWRYAHIASREGFNFHNTYIDLIVQVGWFGLVVIAAVIVVALACLIRRFVAHPSIALCFWLSLLVYQLVRTPIEYIGFTEFYYASVMVFLALGSGFATQTDPQSRQIAPKPPQSARPRFRPG